MPDDTGMTRAARPPRRTAAYQALEARAADLDAQRRAALIERDAALNRITAERADRNAALRRAARAEHLLARAVGALTQWRDEAGSLHPTATAVLVATLADVLDLPSLDLPDGDQLRIVEGPAGVAAFPDPDGADWKPWARENHPERTPVDLGDHAEHPDDDEPPTEP